MRPFTQHLSLYGPPLYLQVLWMCNWNRPKNVSLESYVLGNQSRTQQWRKKLFQKPKSKFWESSWNLSSGSKVQNPRRTGQDNRYHCQQKEMELQQEKNKPNRVLRGRTEGCRFAMPASLTRALPCTVTEAVHNSVIQMEGTPWHCAVGQPSLPAS